MTNSNMLRQGECLFIKTDSFPKGGDFAPAKPEGGRLIVGHSETGHHHVIDLARSPNAQLLIDKTNAFIARLDLPEGAEVEHLRGFDTHAPAILPPGKYEVRYRREHTPEGIRRVED